MTGITTDSPAGQPAPPPENTERGGLDRTVLKGMAWTGGSRWLAQILSWLSTMVVARILTPDDYGIVSMAVVIVSLMGPLGDWGIGTAIVQRPGLSERSYAQLGGLVMLFGLAVSVLTAATAGLMAYLFRQPAVRGVLLVYAFTLFVAAARVLSASLLRRELRFDTLARLAALEAFTSVAVVLLMALLGLGYWALVGGYAISTAVGTVATVLRRPHRVALPRDRALIKDVLTFGTHLTAANFAGLVYNKADFAVVGRLLGSTALGAYTLGWQFASVPVERISYIFSDVLWPVFAKIQDDHKALTRYVLRMSEGLALVIFPITAGLALVADDFVAVALGPKWGAAVLPLRILSFYAGVRSLNLLMGSVLYGKGLMKVALHLQLRAVFMLVPLFYIGARWWGLGGVATAWVVGLPIATVIPAYRIISRLIGFTLRDYFGALRSALEATLLMAAAVLAVNALLPASGHAVVLLTAQVLVGVVTYGLILRVRHWDRIRAFWGLVGELRRTRRPARPVAPAPVPPV
jgi:O-antigen/teichoic acid export membrane protein